MNNSDCPGCAGTTTDHSQFCIAAPALPPVNGSEMTRERLLGIAHSYYKLAKRSRANLVRLAPQYRRKDQYNHEGGYLAEIRTYMNTRRVILAAAEIYFPNVD